MNPRFKFVYLTNVTIVVEADNKVEARAAVEAIARTIKPEQP